MRPNPDEYPASYKSYVERVPETDLLAVMERQLEQIRRIAAVVPPARETFAYAPGKWSIRQLVGHLGDGERVFGFRAFTFSRMDPEPLPGFDENLYVEHCRSALIPLADLVEELAFLRQGNLKMLRNLGPEQWANTGIANANRVSVRALAYVIAGHARHHLGVLRERYGVELPDPVTAHG